MPKNIHYLSNALFIINFNLTYSKKVFLFLSISLFVLLLLCVINIFYTKNIFITLLSFIMGAEIVISKNETIVFIVSFLILFAAESSALTLFAAIALLTLFFLKRKEFYFFWSIIAPRINGAAVCYTIFIILSYFSP